jgi:diguanylate cyclase (GGDEF)-like protein
MTRRGWTWKIWLLAGLAGMAFAAQAEQMSLREYGQADGLDNLAARALAQDRAGFLWAGTENGLYRFDGVRFERIGAEQGLIEVNALAADAAGRVWVGTTDGLFVLQKGALRRVDREGRPITVFFPQGLAAAGADRLWVIDGDGRLLVVSSPDDGEHWRVSDGPAAAQAPLRQLESVLATGDDELWLGCGEALCRLHAGQLEVWDAARGVPRQRWSRLLRSREGALWARSSSGIVQLPAGAERFVERGDAQFVEDPVANYPLLEDAQQRILTAVPQALLRWDGRSWQRFGNDAGLPLGGKLRAMLADREGGVWLGQLGAGVLQWRGYGLWENWSVADGLPRSTVWSIRRSAAPGGQRLHVATGGGLAVFDAAARRFVAAAPDTPATREVSSLEQDGAGGLWAGTRGGKLLRFSNAAGPQPASVESLDQAPSIYRVQRDRDAELWIASDEGVYRWRTEVAGSRPQLADPMAKGMFVDMCRAPDGTLWFAGEPGIARLAGGRWQPARLLEPGRAGRESAIGCLRDGSVVAASADQRLRRLVSQGDAIVATDITPPLLRGRSVLELLEDRRGWLWANTDAGVGVWNGRVWRLLDQRNGLVWNDTSSGALYEDTDGTIWIGTSRGASHLVAPDALFADGTRDATILSVRSNGVSLPTDRRLRLPWSRGALEIGLAVPAYRDRNGLALEYRLAGFDDRWTVAPHTDVRLTGLPAGSYRFEARAADLERGSRSASVALDFEIEPAWWATRTFYAACAALVLGLAWAWSWWRTRALVRAEQRLQALVRERTRELEASQEQLREQATKDALTGAWNRRAILEILEREVGRTRRERRSLTLVLADIDHFKRINDSHGHPAGDAVLREFVARLAGEVRPYDAIGRYGGEEFVLVLPGLGADLGDDHARLGRIHAAIAASPMQAGDTTVAVTCSFGAIGLQPSDQIGAEAMIAAADAALYRAKRGGRDRIEYAQRPFDAAT